MTRHVEIAGAGFAGLAVGIALRQRGWTARIHEADVELRAFGAGIFIWENGLRVLKALGAYEDVMTGSHQAPGYEGRNQRNEQISHEVFGLSRGSRMATMTRQHLYSAMLGAAKRVGVEFVTSSVAVAARPEGALVTSDGRHWPADLVIGAEGVKSNVRMSLALVPSRTKYEFGVIRLLVQRGPDDTPGTNPDNVINYYSSDHRVLYVPCTPSVVYLALAARDSDKISTAIPVNKHVWSEAFPFLEQLFARIGSEARYDTYETNHLDNWSSGKVALVGDSAHSMPPTLGQGAGCALMNALSLAVYVSETDNVVAGLRIWQERERSLTDHTQRIASDYARSSAGSDGASKWDDAAMKAALHVPTGTQSEFA
jgi:2-methyl-3-hydroxypyridine 5-carboxylic acid dioxygenase